MLFQERQHTGGPIEINWEDTIDHRMQFLGQTTIFVAFEQGPHPVRLIADDDLLANCRELMYPLVCGGRGLHLSAHRVAL